jgi:phosphoribosylglycinamide formyltransferase-1
MTRLAVFASGAGTNAENILHYFKNHATIRVSVIICNKSGAGVINVAENHNVPCEIISKDILQNSIQFYAILNKYEIDRIILAGFLLLIPEWLVKAFPEKIVNIHPSLLPSYGGKGMFGMKVHEAVYHNKEEKTGITIHVVDEIYDNGRVLFQKSIQIQQVDTPEAIANKVHELEYKYFPKIIEEWVIFEQNIAYKY